MKVGDLVIRKIPPIGVLHPIAMEQRKELGHGIIVSKQMAGNPSHPCITVYYPKVGKMYDIAESLMEVISASR
tara:strand:- start:254 stop:472 length:219 start_codon:yes stop_codon:yes gene_type:complete